MLSTDPCKDALVVDTYPQLKEKTPMEKTTGNKISSTRRPGPVSGGSVSENLLGQCIAV